MSVDLKLDGTAVPRFPRGVRLKHDESRGEWLLLAPERVIKPDLIALEVLRLCDGLASLDQIIDQLAAKFAADRALIDKDVKVLLTDLSAKRMLDF